jgi:hypothetical protein
VRGRRVIRDCTFSQDTFCNACRCSGVSEEDEENRVSPVSHASRVSSGSFVCAMVSFSSWIRKIRPSEKTKDAKDTKKTNSSCGTIGYAVRKRNHFFDFWSTSIKTHPPTHTPTHPTPTFVCVRTESRMVGFYSGIDNIDNIDNIAQQGRYACVCVRRRFLPTYRGGGISYSYRFDFVEKMIGL